MGQKNSDPSPPNDGVRTQLARKITQMVIWGTICIGVVGIAMSITVISVSTDRNEGTRDAIQIMQYVFGALLPLWGTWIGTILAYYFAKDNFESANKSVRDLYSQITSEKKLEGITAEKAMMAVGQVIHQTMSSNETLAKFNLKKCMEDMKSAKIRRVLIFNEKDHALYAIHRDLISYFIANQALVPGTDVTKLTLEDMGKSTDPDIQNIFLKGVQFITPSDTLLKAKKIMEENKNCQDIFVTATGDKSSPVLGWITDVTIYENSTV